MEQQCTLVALTDHPAELAMGDRPEVIFHPLTGCVISYFEHESQLRRAIAVVKKKHSTHSRDIHEITSSRRGGDGDGGR